MEKEMNIFKKIWYSIGKPKKYEEMSAEGLKKALKYITVLIILFSFIIAGISVYKIHQNYEEQRVYVEEKLPELSYSKGTLKFETENEIILEDETVQNIVGGTVIINTNSSDEALIESYQNEILESGNNGVILLTEKLILVSSSTETKSVQYSYSELFEEYFGEDLEFKKADVINYLNEVSYLSYFMTYTVTYFVSMYIILAVNILVMSLVGLLYVKLFKINKKYKDNLILSIYASTIAVLLNILYYILLGIFNIGIPYFDVVYISVPYIYLIISLQGMRKAQNSK